MTSCLSLRSNLLPLNDNVWHHQVPGCLEWHLGLHLCHSRTHTFPPFEDQSDGPTVLHLSPVLPAPVINPVPKCSCQLQNYRGRTPNIFVLHFKRVISVCTQTMRLYFLSCESLRLFLWQTKNTKLVRFKGRRGDGYSLLERVCVMTKRNLSF